MEVKICFLDEASTPFQLIVQMSEPDAPNQGAVRSEGLFSLPSNATLHREGASYGQGDKRTSALLCSRELASANPAVTRPQAAERLSPR